MATDRKKDRAKKKQEQLRSKAFWIAFEMIFVFGLPAAAAVVLSQWLIADGIIPDWGLYLALGLAFIISWVIVFLRVRRLSDEFQEVERGQ
ncbi:MAG: hypothetical protein WD335_01645 [Candidatus Paceibacterota bacterium]